MARLKPRANPDGRIDYNWPPLAMPSAAQHQIAELLSQPDMPKRVRDAVLRRQQGTPLAADNTTLADWIEKNFKPAPAIEAGLRGVGRRSAV